MHVAVVTGPDAGRVLFVDRAVVVGNGAPADLALRDGGSPASLVRLSPTPSGVVLEDLTATGRVWLDGWRVDRPATLAGEHHLRVGDTVLAVTTAPAGFATAPTPVTDGIPASAVVGGAVMALLGLFLLAAVVGTAGAAAGGVALLAAIVPAPLLLALVVLLDRNEPEPKWILALVFLWGAGVATFAAGILNEIGLVVLTAVLGAGAGEALTVAAVAPVVEEALKAVPLVALVAWRRHEVNGVLDAVVYAGMVGLGFGIVEDVSYYADAATQGGEVLAATVVARGVVSPFAHPLFTAMTAIGLFLALEAPRLRWLWPAGGLTLAVLLHAIWNGSTLTGGGFLVAYALFFVPVFAFTLGVVVWAVRRERAILRVQLAHEVATGTVLPWEVEVVAAPAARRSHERHAARLGPGAQRTVRRAHHALVELGLARHRHERSSRPDDAAEVERWRAELGRARHA